MISQILMTKYQRPFTNDYSPTTINYLRIITYFQIHPFMQNKPNFRKTEMSVNLFNTKNYEENGDSGHEKTNPIQTQFNPKQTQFNPISKPIQSQLKPIFIPFAEAFGWSKERNFGKIITKPINCFYESVMKRIVRKFIS